MEDLLSLPFCRCIDLFDTPSCLSRDFRQICRPHAVKRHNRLHVQLQPPTEMFYGANSASVRDPFGHVWVLLSWKEDLDPAEMERRGTALLSGNTREKERSTG